MCRDHCWGLIKDAALCTEQGGKWVNMNQNFDNLLVGTISLFEISTTEGWVDVMLAAVDSRGPYLQPRRDANEFIGSLLFVAFMLIGSFFVLNLCVGVIIDNYNKQKSASDASCVLVTETQAAWMTQMKALYLRRSFFTQVNVDQLGPSRQHRFRIITSSAFENFIMACIVMQLCVLMMVWQPRDESLEVFLNTCGFVFTVIFHVEFFLKLSALHCNYFREYWNIFDFFCVVTSDVVAILEASITVNGTVNLSALVSALRIFRVARLFRLVRFLKGLNKLLLAFALSVPKLLNVGLVMVLLLYLYAVLGVSLFAKVAYTGAGIYGPQTNFRSFFQAVSLLIRSMTGEGFNEIMHDLTKSQWYYESILEKKCSELDLESRNFAELDLNGDGLVDDPTECGTAFAYIYFISYTIFVSFVILNLFIAVIFEGFEESRGSELKEVITKCLENWESYDPFNTMLVPLPKALDFIDETVEELMSAHQPQKGQCIPESRWDSRSTIDMNASEAMWSMYNLQYVRTLGLHVRADGRVRLVQAVRAVLRRLLVAGGPYSTFLPLQERRQRVRELEVLEAMAGGETEPDVAELAALEARQNKHIQEALGDSTFLARTSQVLHPQVGSGHGQSGRKEDGEFSMLEKVAAAKIQRRSKESFQRRRARARSDRDSRAFGHGPITRAAG
ncbi:NaCP60E [Symbiodinium pilosum]|uniref:NaCP60E protein n=1 Tax=Symbiodinium pilosum TaxID=2952 RepID=A0A812VMA5_SYMPI|nr:NaCP60E [Symbiodinium pilosum]